jgi:hypothetical protein
MKNIKKLEEADKDRNNQVWDHDEELASACTDR